ncbi:MAG: UvrD-helicase domain-containing protein [Sneathiella sp.]|nr:UvrD-helicase domain-containing protein [Sneathiella sp.]
MSLAGLIEDGIARQKSAADPAHSVWVSASAGSGKTRVLVERSLRLMLAGTRPEKILCITYTKAAAAEMANRLNEMLGSWSVMAEAALAQSLNDLIGREPSPAELLRARRLFASVLDAPGGLKIQTIHAFCESVLGRFPLEARLSPNFEVMDERTAGEIMQTALADLLIASRQPKNADLSAALQLASEKVNEESFTDLMRSLSQKRGQLAALIQAYGDPGDVIAALAREIGIDPDESEEHLISQSSRETAFAGPALRRAVDHLLMGSVQDVRVAEKIAPWLLQPDKRLALFPDYLTAFFTQKGAISASSKLATKKVVEACPDILDILLAEAARLQKVQENIKKTRVLMTTAALIRLGAALVDRYEEERRGAASLIMTT